MLKKLLRYFLSLFKQGKKFRYKIVTDIPQKLKYRTIYLTANDGYVWQAMMLCPCGCGIKLFINLIEEQKPSWYYTVNENNDISLYPSIHRKVDCKSHFFLRKGKVIWVN